MEFMDMHCDSLSTLLLTDSGEANLHQAKATMVDFARMKQVGQLAQFFAVFLPFPGAFEKLGLPPMTDEAYIQTLRQWLLQNVQQHAELIGMAYNTDDVLKNRAAGKMSAILTMEDGRAVDGRLENLKRFYNQQRRAVPSSPRADG